MLVGCKGEWVASGRLKGVCSDFACEGFDDGDSYDWRCNECGDVGEGV